MHFVFSMKTIFAKHALLVAPYSIRVLLFETSLLYNVSRPPFPNLLLTKW
jgi:hypothetical protein